MCIDSVALCGSGANWGNLLPTKETCFVGNHLHSKTSALYFIAYRRFLDKIKTNESRTSILINNDHLLANERMGMCL
jgi:hypothetical protein